MTNIKTFVLPRVGSKRVNLRKIVSIYFVPMVPLLVPAVTGRDLNTLVATTPQHKRIARAAGLDRPQVHFLDVRLLLLSC